MTFWGSLPALASPCHSGGALELAIDSNASPKMPETGCEDLRTPDAWLTAANTWLGKLNPANVTESWTRTPWAAPVPYWTWKLVVDCWAEVEDEGLYLATDDGHVVQLDDATHKSAEPFAM
jgi:hypothetical protein